MFWFQVLRVPVYELLMAALDSYYDAEQWVSAPALVRRAIEEELLEASKAYTMGSRLTRRLRKKAPCRPGRPVMGSKTVVVQWQTWKGLWS